MAVAAPAQAPTQLAALPELQSAQSGLWEALSAPVVAPTPAPLDRTGLLGAGPMDAFLAPFRDSNGTGPQLADETMGLIYLDAISTDAICNDGSPGAYYWQASKTGSPLWIVYLQGGMWCWDEASCSARNASVAFEMTSAGWPKTVKMGGIFSAAPANPWADANKVYLGCAGRNRALHVLS